jgi:hypothetical protein
MPPKATSGAARSTWRRWWLAAAALALALIVLLLRSSITWRSSKTGGDSTEGPEGSRSRSTRVPRISIAPDSIAEQIPGAHCWQGLLDVDRLVSLDALRDVLARAAASDDELLASYVEDRLADFVGGDVARAMKLLEWTDRASGKELETIYGALKRTAAVRDPAVAQRLLRTGEAANGDVDRRSAALAALETQHRLSTEDIGRLKTVALDPKASDVAWSAARTVGRVMKEDFERTGTYAPYWEQLLDISRTSHEPAVRALALEMPAYADPILERRYVEDLANMLTTAPEREVREMAAFQLGLTEDPDRALAVFRAAFPRERDLCVRWAILRFALRAAGPRALPMLEELVRIDPRFRADLDEFAKLYKTGVLDFERIWLDKSDPHACVDDAAEHGG